MSVNWSWKDKKGEVYISQKRPNGDGCFKFKVNIYSANCLGAFIYEFKDEGVNKYQFYTFFSDLDHLKKCIGLKKNYNGEYDNIFNKEWDKWTKIRLNVYYDKQETLKMASLFAQAGFKVELYYKEPKQPKQKKKGN